MDLNFVNLFFKCGNYHKSRSYKQILKLLGISTFRKFFLIFNRRTHVKNNPKFQKGIRDKIY
ncbi:hypothetical protein LBBP_02539 [Leptospira borgpetersenii serovar Ballum]|uniref:Uncharacterized protein n=1 Tax=Leptospira borgpetersenii serovar Ballum TaxID=280505 RepID=A0A0S2ISY7_LEPBO|nr:hypothetical protein LBBP_02539 [Leptospira borgpetersenii serovar Ballum]